MRLLKTGEQYKVETSKKPLEQKLMYEAATACAKDFAHGVMDGLWSPLFIVELPPDGSVERWKNGGFKSQRDNLKQYLNGELWAPASLVSPYYLEVFEYFERVSAEYRETARGVTYKRIEYILTPRAMRLLERPEIPPSVFIAYKRGPSSAFTLLIEARLKAERIKAFIDKDIPGGEEWEELIRKKIQEEVDIFICLLSEETLGSTHVRQEIRWAHEVKEKVFSIPIWHPGYEIDVNELASYDDEAVEYFVKQRNAIRVTDDSASEYDSAVSKLLNQLGFVS